MGWWRRWAGHWRSGDCSTAVSRRYCSWTGTQVLQYYACLLPLVDISHPHAAVLLFYNITLFQTVSQWRVFLTKPRPLHPQPGAARRPALPGADRKCFVTKLNPIVNYLSPFPPFPLPVAPLLSPYNASFHSKNVFGWNILHSDRRQISSQIKGRKKIEASVYVFQSVYW